MIRELGVPPDAGEKFVIGVSEPHREPDYVVHLTSDWIITSVDVDADEATLQRLAWRGVFVAGISEVHHFLPWQFARYRSRVGAPPPCGVYVHRRASFCLVTDGGYVLPGHLTSEARQWLEQLKFTITWRPIS